MTRKEAKEKLYLEWQKFLENNIDYAGISEAYKMAFRALEQEPCEDAISRAEALRHSFYIYDDDGFGYKVIYADKIKQLPSVKLQEKIGHWIWRTEDIYRCSECGNDIRVKEVMNVPQYVCCPMCEARMIKPQESEE